MIGGRILFGVGSEAMYIVQMVFLTAWFKDYEYNLSMGITDAIPNLFTVMGGNLTPRLYNSGGFLLSYGIGFLICCGSLGSAILIVILDKYQVAKDKKWLETLKEQKKADNDISFSSRDSEDEALANEDIKCSDIKSLKTEYWCSVSCNMLSEMTITNAITIASGML